MKEYLEQALKDIITTSLLTERKKKSWQFRAIRKPDFQYREKTVKLDSSNHLEMLKKTLEHLEALKDIYHTGSANRHVISQACTRIKRLVKRLEKNI